VPDTIDDARQYLKSVIGSRGGDAQREAFLQSGPKVLDYLESRTDLVFVAAQAHPDYLANHPGAAYGGRALSPVPFDGRKLGTDFDRVRPPRPEFLILGGMMVLRTDIPHLVKPFGSLKSFTHVSRMILRHAIDRVRYRRGTNLVMGNAIVARLLYSLRKQQVPIRFDTALVDLIQENGKVVGAVLEGPAGRTSVLARKGVVLATGGIAWNENLRAKLFPAPARRHSLAPRSNTGDGIDIGMRAGAELDDTPDSAGLWMPCSIFKRPDGTTSVYPHIILDRSKPGLIAVNKAGRRFANEGDSYHDFVMAMLRSTEAIPSVPAHLICDRSFLVDYGLGLAYPGTKSFKTFIDAGYLIEADTLHDLAAKIDVDPTGLEQTVADHNRYAETGIDEEFGRGTSDLNRINGDPTNKPNPCMRKIGPGPFYAVAVWPADLAGSAGLYTDADARALAHDGQPVDGLYACGNDASSIFRGTYPGPGTTLGPAIVFGWRAAMHAAGKLEQSGMAETGTKLAS
jgi:succinate dehydrogenase/fumarate reductase flavoprotein subunit